MASHRANPLAATIPATRKLLPLTINRDDVDKRNPKAPFSEPPLTLAMDLESFDIIRYLHTTISFIHVGCDPTLLKKKEPEVGMKVSFVADLAVLEDNSRLGGFKLCVRGGSQIGWVREIHKNLLVAASEGSFEKGEIITGEVVEVDSFLGFNTVCYRGKVDLYAVKVSLIMIMHICYLHKYLYSLLMRSYRCQLHQEPFPHPPGTVLECRSAVAIGLS